jgi:hypothetical protein
MADLRERGQIMLVAGFVLAAAFIALALIMNSVIYTENLATRDAEARGAEALAYKSDTVDGAERLIEFENRNITVGEETFANIEENYTRSLRSMSNGSATIQSIDGERTQIELISTTEGTRFGQRNASRNFTDVNGLEVWEVANDIHGTRAFRINITNSDVLLDDTETGIPFTVEVIGSSDTWSVEVRNVSGSPETELETSTNGVTGVTCTLGEPDPEIDVIKGTVSGEQCPGYEFGESVSKPYRIEYVAAQNITGNFSLVANTTSFTGVNYDAETDSPFNASAIYSAKVHVTHESTDIVYETDARARPGESDE